MGKKVNSQDMTDYYEDGTFDTNPVKTYIQIQKRHFAKGEFFQMTFELLELLEDFKGADYKTLKALLQRLDFNNRIKTFTQAVLANEAGIAQPKISKALKTLEEKKIIYKDGLDWYFSDKFINYANNKGKNK
jgi:hypothetical protein